MAGKVNVPIGVAIQGLANTQKQLQMLTRGIGGVGKTAGVAAIGFAAFVGAVRGADFAAQAIAGARDLERNMAGLKTVFESTTPQMTQFSKNAVEMGLSMTDASKASVFIGSVLKQSGFSIQETADLTERLVGLGTDLSITYGYDVQEALMGMTALFRGEYDPIEKFGVAMKQSEINSELAARGFDHLEGAARRYAEQQIRVELLFQRSADAQGAMARQSGTLAAEQIKLAASFENVRDTVATSMLPVITDIMMDLQDVMADLQPQLQAAFEAAAPAVERLAEVLVPALGQGLINVVDFLTRTFNLISDILDPTTAIGESFAAIGANFESLVTTIFGRGVEIEDVFNGIGIALQFGADMLSDIIRFIDITIIGFKTIGEMIHAMFTGDWDKFFNTDWSNIITGQIESRDAFVAQELAIAKANEELRKTQKLTKEITRQAASLSLSNLPKYIRDSLGAKAKPTPLGGGGGDDDDAGKQAKDYVKEFFDSLREEVAKEQARLKLERIGASEGLIDSILGSQGWEKVFARVIASGTKGIKKLQDQFDRTSAGIKALEATRKALEDEAAKAIEVLEEKAKKLEQAFIDADLAAQDFKRTIAATAQLDILPTADVELGRFEEQIVSTFANIRQDLAQGLLDGRILQKDFNTLTAFVMAEQEQLAIVARNRDDLANRYALSKALIQEYKDALTGSMQLTTLLSNLKEKTEERTVTETTKGVMRLGKSLREFEVTVSRSYEDTSLTVAQKTEGILTGFREMAEKARAFGENLRKLRALGLDDQLFNQLVQAGVDAGGETAQALVDGGKETITELNGLFRDIDSLGADLGEEVARTLYGSGVDMATGLLEGIMSQQAAMEQKARDLADAFSKAFSQRVNTAVTVVTDMANKDAKDARDAVPKLENIDFSALEKINKLIEGAQRYIKNQSDMVLKFGAQEKLDLYNALKNDILGGKAVDLSGVRSGMSAEEIAIATGRQEAPTVTYNVTVNASNYPGGAQAGQAFVEELKSFERNNGSVGNFLIQGLA
jgi:hypothetical protein